MVVVVVVGGGGGGGGAGGQTAVLHIPSDNIHEMQLRRMDTLGLHGTQLRYFPYLLLPQLQSQSSR